MDRAHWILLFLWIMYCVIHSFFAGTNIKNRIEKNIGSLFKYYRPLYSFFAFVSLAIILWFQFSIQSSKIFTPSFFIYSAAIIAAFSGLIIMVICIKKYFYELSGLQALQHSAVKNTLQQSGLHKYVRHPLYLGTLLFVWGLFLIFPLVTNLIAVAVITIYVLIGINLEEKKLYIEYGECYKAYSKKVPRLIPYVRRIKKRLRIMEP